MQSLSCIYTDKRACVCSAAKAAVQCLQAKVHHMEHPPLARLLITTTHPHQRLEQAQVEVQAVVLASSAARKDTGQETAQVG